MTLRTQRLELEPLRVDHAEALFEGLSDPALYRYFDQEPPQHIVTVRDRFSRQVAGPANGNSLWRNFALKLSAGDEYAGMIETTIHPKDHAYIAYLVFDGYRQRGLAREACEAVVAWLEKVHEVRKVVAQMDTRNEASRRLVESLGFQRVSTTEAAAYFKGRVSDEYRYELNCAS